MADGSVHMLDATQFNEYWTNQQTTMQNAIVFEPEVPVGESKGAGVISVPASGTDPVPPLPPAQTAQ